MMKAKERHDLHTNALAEWLSETGEQLRPHSGLITVGVIAVAIAVLVFFYMQGASQRGAVAASDQLIAALDMGGQSLAELQATAKDFPGTSQAAVAQLLMAETVLDAGANTIYHNKPAGRDNISKAMAVFDDVQKTTHDPMLRAWAIFGLARAQESLGDLDQARLAYVLLSKEYPDSALAGPARQHLNRLNQPATKEFYDWFALQNPQPPKADTGPGVPGLKPSFDLKESASPGDVKLPSAMGPGATEQSANATAPASTLPAATPPAAAEKSKSTEASK
jgi:predicted negative regulator of RcsB-dependent stress response